MIRIGDKYIGEGHPCYVIAEAGVNHNGDPDLALALIDAAAEAQADAVKFQTFKAEKLVTGAAPQAAYQTRNTGKEESQYDMLKRLELDKETHLLLQAHARKRGIDFLSTPFDEESAAFLAEIGIPCFKVGSGDLTNHPLLRQIAAFGLPLILSTGMATLAEVQESLGVLQESNTPPLAVLHCTTNYPCPPEEVNLRAMLTLARETGTLTGYSDHTAGILAPVLAVGIGAAIIEKHFTLDKNMEGPDHKASLDPVELAEMIRQIRETETMLGTGEKVPNPSELEIMQQARKSLTLSRALPAGHVLRAEDLCVKRPGTGIVPGRFEATLGRKLHHDLPRDHTLTEADLEDAHG